MRALPGAGFAGANVTIPHKEAALALADEATATARAIGAANTLSFAPDGAIAADNTDAPGLLAALGDLPPAQRADPRRGRLGAGRRLRAGAGRAPRSRSGTARPSAPVRSRPSSACEAVAAPVPADVLVNCTSVGLTDPSSTFKNLPLRADSVGEYACVVDLVYRAGGTVLAQEARRRGSQVIDGLEILVQQGALSFEGWTGRGAPLQVMQRSAARMRIFPTRHEPRPSPSAPRTAHRGGRRGPGR